MGREDRGRGRGRGGWRGHSGRGGRGRGGRQGGNAAQQEPRQAPKRRQYVRDVPRRPFDEDTKFLKRIDENTIEIEPGFVPEMQVKGRVYISAEMADPLYDELRQQGGRGGFLPAFKQLANVAALPGIVSRAIGLPDIHAGYGFAIGNCAAFDTSNPASIISPGGVGYDINCGVRLLRTNLTEKDIEGLTFKAGKALYEAIPCGVGGRGSISLGNAQLDDVLTSGIDWCRRNEYCTDEDVDHCEENGQMQHADPTKVSARAKKRGQKQLGTLGAGNHYVEIQIVDEIHDPQKARAMGIDQKGQVCLMIHTGSRGLGYQVCDDYLDAMKSATDHELTNDEQLTCARLTSDMGQNYFGAMSAAANFAFANRTCITYMARNAFAKVFDSTPDDLDMSLIYDVSHNIAKLETHMVDGREKELMVHRKGCTRAFPPGHRMVPVAYHGTGQPVLVGGSMGTSSYLLAGTERGYNETFGTTCHGAGRLMSRSKAIGKLNYDAIVQSFVDQNINVFTPNANTVLEEAPDAYKDVSNVVDTCHRTGISEKVVKLRPVSVIKG